MAKLIKLENGGLLNLNHVIYIDEESDEYDKYGVELVNGADWLSITQVDRDRIIEAMRGNRNKHDPANLSVEKLRFSNKHKYSYTAWLIVGTLLSLIGLVACWYTKILIGTPYDWIFCLALIPTVCGLVVVSSTAMDIKNHK